MIELAVANIIYVSYRLVISGPLVRFLLKWLPYYFAVVIMAETSFVFDYFVFDGYFQGALSTSFDSLIVTNVLYVVRVVAAWWLIKQIWNRLGNYWLSVLLGAEITFVIDYLLFDNLLHS